VLWTSQGVGVPGGIGYRLGDRLFTSGGGRVAAVDADDGKRLWLTDCGRKGRMNAPVALVGGRLVVPGGWDDNHVYGLDPGTGKLRWQANVAGFPCNVAAWGADKVLVPTHKGHLLAIRAESGAIVADLKLGVRARVAPIVAGGLVIGPSRGVLTAYRASPSP
jgi:outer membrane protein assembly factor BamB